MPSPVIHSSPYSGNWYPSDPLELESLVGGLFEASARRMGSYVLSNPLAFVVPHAGLVYSGTVACAVYRQLRAAQPRRIFLLGFAHRGSLPGVWVPDLDAFETPLGRMAVDRETAERLLAHPEFGRMPEATLCDHSVEIQLPLLQKAAPEARLVPIYVASLTPAKRVATAAVLAKLLGDGTVLIASSDFTHYGRAFDYQPFPEDGATPSRLRQLDETVMESAGSLRAELFVETLRQTGATVCGREPVALLLAALRSLPNHEDIFQVTLDYQTSGEITGEFGHSVSYAGLGYYPDSAFLLGEGDCELLLESARETLRNYQESGQPRPVRASRATKAVERPGGAFVTIRRQGQLRGCVGRCSAVEKLATIVPELTLSAARDDSRFDPVGREETGLDVEVSILSPLKRITAAGELQVGRDGAYLRSGDHGGLLLPQVATERNWNRDQFLCALAEKAGVGAGVYEDSGTRLSVFRAQVIH